MTYQLYLVIHACILSGIGTQGADRDSWVTLYTLEWSEEGESWEPYQEDGHDKVP